MQFQVRSARQGDPVIADRVLDAPSESILRERLLSEGVTVLSLQRAKPLNSKAASALKGQYPIFCRELRTLIRAGMTIVEAVDTLAIQATLAGNSSELASAVLARLQRGQALSIALEELPETPLVLIAAVRAGERTSNLAEALDDYLRYHSLVEQLRRKLVSAAIYPSLVMGLGLVIAIFLLLVVMPNFARMYDNLRGAPGGRAAFMISISQFVAQHRPELMGALVLAGIFLVMWIRNGHAKRALINLGQSSEWLRVRLEDFNLAMMYQALSLMLKGGFPMTEAMAVASKSSAAPRLASALANTQHSVERGGSVSAALATNGLCDEVGRRLMAAAERNGDFHLAADVVSRMHGERFELFIERVTRIVEPVLLLAVALLIGAIVVSMYLPVFEMATRLR